MNPRFCILLVLFLGFGAGAARAQWQNVTYTLRGGWNAIYLHGDMPQAGLDAILADQPAVLEVWRWNPNPSPAQFESSPLIPSAAAPEWSRWQRSNPGAATLNQLTGQASYLVRCAGASTSTYSLQLVQKIRPPASLWVRNGANFQGFPSRLSGASYPLFSNYFATFPAAIATNSRIFKYVGGDLGPGNPIQVFAPNFEPLDRNQAYWFEAAVVGDFYAPLEITPSSPDGLHFGRTGSRFTVRVRNRTSATVTITVAPQSSLGAPAGQTPITGAVPITRRQLDAATAAVQETALDTAFTQVIAPQSAIELEFGVNRALMTGSGGAFYASFLRFTDSGNLFDISLPVSASVGSLAGLWVGDVYVNRVQSRAPGSPGDSTSRAFPLRVLLHVDDSGVARLLSGVFLGPLADSPGGTAGLATREARLKADAKAQATRFVSTQLPPDTELSTGSGSVALGSTLVRTLTLPFNERTNPFVHAYHPDHDNRDARLQPVGAGVESFTVTRACSFQFTVQPPDGVPVLGWGASVIGGNYSETLTGLHRLPITVGGTFQLRRVSEIGTILLD